MNKKLEKKVIARIQKLEQQIKDVLVDLGQQDDCFSENEVVNAGQEILGYREKINYLRELLSL